MPKIVLYAVIGILGVVVLKSLVAPKLPQTLVVTPQPSGASWWQDLISAGALAYKDIWGKPAASPTPAPSSGSSSSATGADDYMTPSWLS